MRINVGCGKQTWPDFFCIDAVEHPKATRPLDLKYAFQFAPNGALLQQIPLDSQCADEVHSYHFIEHVYAWEAPAVIGEFHRLLKPGGRLVVECPDIAKAARHLLGGAKDQLCMWPLYGDPKTKDPYMCHRWGYTPDTLKRLLKDNGFTRIQAMAPQTHGRRVNRDMRLEAIRV